MNKTEQIEQIEQIKLRVFITMSEQNPIKPTEISDNQSLKNVVRLSAKQYHAIELILAGKSDAQIAETVGKRRNTIWQWRNHNPQFIAALNQRQKQLQEESVKQMENLCSQSLEVIERALDDVGELKPGVQLALAVIRASISQFNLLRLQAEPNHFAIDDRVNDTQPNKGSAAIVTLYPQPPVS